MLFQEGWSHRGHPCVRDQPASRRGHDKHVFWREMYVRKLEFYVNSHVSMGNALHSISKAGTVVPTSGDHHKQQMYKVPCSDYNTAAF